MSELEEPLTFSSALHLIWWLLCLLPPTIVLGFEADRLDKLGGDSSGLMCIGQILIAVGFGLTAGIVFLVRWIARNFRIRSRLGSATPMIVIVAVLSPQTYLSLDWLGLAIIEISSLPAAFILAFKPVSSANTSKGG